MTKTNVIQLLIKARSEIQPPKKEGTNPHFRSRYVTLEGCIEAVTQPLANNGFFLSQQVKSNELGSYVTTKIYHQDYADWLIESTVPLVLAKNDMQGLGSAVTYARRYGIMSLLNLPSEDDDANQSTVQTNSLADTASEKTKSRTQTWHKSA
tara:strand:+ start:325 stop:780 length:456 start_codon:yes stop_codon:yes gene_type:complete